MRLLFALPSRGGTINVIRKIVAHYFMFGVFLLNDDNGTLVRALTSQHHHYDAENITTAILQCWLDGKGKTPVSWATLIGALREIDLDELADQIENALLDIPRSTPTAEKATELEMVSGKW